MKWCEAQRCQRKRCKGSDMEKEAKVGEEGRDGQGRAGRDNKVVRNQRHCVK